MLAFFLTLISVCHAFYPARTPQGFQVNNVVPLSKTATVNETAQYTRGGGVVISGTFPDFPNAVYFAAKDPVYDVNNISIQLGNTCIPLRYAVTSAGLISVAIPPDAPLGVQKLRIVKGNKGGLLFSTDITVTQYSPSFFFKDDNAEANHVSGIIHAYNPNTGLLRFVSVVTPDQSIYAGFADDEVAVIFFNITGFYISDENQFLFTQINYNNTITAIPSLLSVDNFLLRIPNSQWLIVTVPNDFRKVIGVVTLSFPLVNTPALLQFN